MSYMRLLALMFTATVIAQADQGLVPRPDPSEYSAHKSDAVATLAGSIVPRRQVETMFTADIAKRYIVVEVAVYPQSGQRVSVQSRSFSLKVGNAVSSAVRPSVSGSWSEKNKTSTSNNPITTVSTTGVILEKGTDGNGQSRSRVGVYESVAVTNDPRAVPAPTSSRPDPQAVEQRVDEVILPEGEIAAPVAGYLFFVAPKAKTPKVKAVELRWSGPENRVVSLEIDQK